MSRILTAKATVESFLAKLTRYTRRDRIKQDCVNALEKLPKLNVVKGMMPRRNGAQDSLICLTGNIPYTYYGKIYSVPLSIFLDFDYPEGPPRIYLKTVANVTLNPKCQIILSRGILSFRWTEESTILTAIAEITAYFETSPPFVATKPQPNLLEPTLPSASKFQSSTRSDSQPTSTTSTVVPSQNDMGPESIVNTLERLKVNVVQEHKDSLEATTKDLALIIERNVQLKRSYEQVAQLNRKFLENIESLPPVSLSEAPAVIDPTNSVEVNDEISRRLCEASGTIKAVEDAFKIYEENLRSGMLPQITQDSVDGYITAFYRLTEKEVCSKLVIKSIIDAVA